MRALAAISNWLHTFMYSKYAAGLQACNFLGKLRTRLKFVRGRAAPGLGEGPQAVTSSDECY